MSKPRYLPEYSDQQLQEFLDSFDIVLSDCDGVLWYIMSRIAGALDSVQKFQELGKRVYLVSNNSVASIDQYSEKLKSCGLTVDPEHIINTATVITWYLKKINFTGEAFVIGSTAFKTALTKAGIKIAPPLKIEEKNLIETVHEVEDRPSIKAVIVDVDLYCGWGQMAFATSCLKRKDVLFLCGATDEWVVYDSSQRKVLGPGPLTELIVKQSGRTPTPFAKPSEILKEYVFEHCKIEDPRRCLFIGDTVNQDMQFAALCGFQKLFVGTGCDTYEYALAAEKTAPDYYITTLGQLCPLIELKLENCIKNGNS